jgi:hypothetical protein
LLSLTSTAIVKISKKEEDREEKEEAFIDVLADREK